MHFRILGPLEIRRADTVVHLESREERALAVRLLLAGGRAVPPSRLADDIWGGEPPPDAESRVTHHLARLQRALDPDRPADTAGGVLVRDAAGYRLAITPDEVDATRFEALVAEGRRALDEGDARRAEERFRGALMMWWGDALGDLAAEPFARAEAARLQALWRSAALGRVEALLALGYAREARGDLEQLMDTVAPADRRGRGHGGGPARLVGREREMALLERMLDEARSGQRRVVALAGEPGIGKTRLVTEFAGRAQSGGALVVTAPAHPGQGSPPYWHWAQALRRLLASVPPETAAAAFAPHSGLVARLAPEIGTILPGTRAEDEALPASIARSRLAEAVTRGLAWIADRTPVVVVLEDLHRADAASLFLLRYLAASPPVGSLLVVATYRTEDPEPDVARALAPFRGGRSLLSIDLDGLKDAEVAELLDALGRRALGREEVATIAERADGNPFFVEEMARALRQRSVDSPAALPPNGRSLLRRRLQGLPAATGQLIDVAAVMGERVDLPAMESLYGDASAQLRPAVDRGVLVAGERPSKELRFRHELVRATVYDGLDPVRRAELHGTVGAVLRDAGGRPADEVAEHLWRAVEGGQRQYVDDAVWAELDAADHALAMSSVEQAADHLDRATTLLSIEGRPEIRGEREAQVGARWVRLHEVEKGLLAPEIASAVRSVWAAVRGPTVVADMAVTGRTGWTHHVLRGELTPARALAEDLVRRGTDASEPRTLAVGLIGLGHVRFLCGETEAARSALQRGLEIADASDASDGPLRRERVRARAFLGPVLEVMGESSHAVGMLDAALGHAARPDDAVVLHLSAALAGVIAGDPARVIVAAREGEDVARARSLSLYLPLARALTAWAAVNLGDPSGERDLDDALRQLDAMGLRWMRALRLGLRAEAAVARGDLDAGFAHLDAALDEVAESGERLYEPELHRLRAELLAGAGEETGAEQALAVAIDLSRSSGARAFEARARTTARLLGLPAAG